jgi:hypothetical protein
MRPNASGYDGFNQLATAVHQGEIAHRSRPVLLSTVDALWQPAARRVDGGYHSGQVDLG